MATIQINAEVDSANFEAFYEIFQRYRSGAESQPAVWAKVAASAQDTQQSFAGAAESARGIADAMSDALKGSTGLERSSNQAANHWTRLARGTRDTAANIKDATVALLKWANITGVVTGLVGAGGIYGIDTLAHSVAANRSSAMASGTTYGGLQALRANYGRFGDADSLLTHLAEAQTNVEKRLPFAALNIPEQQWQGDTVDLATTFMESFKRYVDNTPKEVLGNYLENTKLNQIVSTQDALKYKNTRPEEVHEVAENIRRDRSSMELTPETQKRWQDLSTQLTRAWQQIEKTFVTKLVIIEPGLSKLSDTIADMAANLLRKNGPISQWLDAINSALLGLSSNQGPIQSKLEGFIGFVESAGTALFKLAGEALQLVHWLGEVLSDESPTDQAGVKNQSGDPSAPGGVEGQGGAGGRVDHFANTGKNDALRARGRGAAMAAHHLGHWWTPERIKHAYDRLTAMGWSPKGAAAQIARMAYIEAPGGPDSVNATGHRGIAQWDAARWARVGGDKGFDAQISALGSETNNAESKAGDVLHSAKTDREGARGSSMLERAEDWNAKAGTDAYTETVTKLVPKVEQIIRDASNPPKPVAPAKPVAPPSKQAVAPVGPASTQVPPQPTRQSAPQGAPPPVVQAAPPPQAIPELPPSEVPATTVQPHQEKPKHQADAKPRHEKPSTPSRTTVMINRATGANPFTSAAAAAVPP